MRILVWEPFFVPWMALRLSLQPRVKRVYQRFQISTNLVTLVQTLKSTLDLAKVTAREAKVLRMRFGIGMNTDHTLEEVGKQFDVTRERIRQIEAKALRKLRHPSRSSHLKSFLDD